MADEPTFDERWEGADEYILSRIREIAKFLGGDRECEATIIIYDAESDALKMISNIGNPADLKPMLEFVRERIDEAEPIVSTKPT